MRRIAVLMLAIAIVSCDPSNEKIADADDYNTYLAESEKRSSDSAEAGIQFWNRKLGSDSSGVGAIGPLASAYTKRFKSTGNPADLYHAQHLLEKGVEYSAHNKDGYLISLAGNFISQHRFKEGEAALTKALEMPSNKRNVELALFDVEMELGNYNEAYRLLKKNQRRGDFSYLIRKSKWADHEGKLSEAIRFLEEAKELAQASADNSLIVWSITNLADYYGHAGEIEKSYKYYLKALELNPDNAYALKGIAWINYSHDKNYKEADRILSSLIKTRPMPDYYLLKSEIAAAQGLEQESAKWRSEFLALASLPQHGRMYNTHLIETMAEISPSIALQRAKDEVGERKTPETYALLAFALMQNGETKNAIETLENYVVKKTFEPVPTFYAAKVFAMAGDTKRSADIAAELKDTAYELGPLTYSEIKAILKGQHVL